MLKKVSKKHYSKTLTAVDQMKKLGLFSMQEVHDLGLSKITFLKLVKTGVIVREARGFYSHKDNVLDPAVSDFAIACKKFGPNAVIAGPTALFHYHLINEVPRQIWVVTQSSVKTTESLYRCIRTSKPIKIGIEDHGNYRITNVERTLMEAFKYSSKFGLSTALGAVKKAFQDQKTDEIKISKMAKAMGLKKLLEKYWEMIVAEAEEYR